MQSTAYSNSVMEPNLPVVVQQQPQQRGARAFGPDQEYRIFEDLLDVGRRHFRAGRQRHQCRYP